MLFQMRSNVLFRRFLLLTAQVGSNFVIICTNSWDCYNFSSPDKILAYAGCSPSTYQSGKLTNCYAHMEKRDSRYLRYALYNATKYVCHWNPVFAEYLAKKRAEGKHYNVALSHATKKLVRRSELLTNRSIQMLFCFCEGWPGSLCYSLRHPRCSKPSI